MDLLTNAIESIRAGVEDYQEGSSARLLASVRSIHAGILLLYKEALRRLSPPNSNESLLKVRVPPQINAAGIVEFVGKGKKTVDVQQERFESLNITTDWNRFDRITDTRNEIEHYYTKANKKILEGLISDAFIVTRNFLAGQLKEDPLALLGEDTWQSMLKVSDVHEAERKDCEKLLEAVDWNSQTLAAGVMNLACPECGGDLLRPDPAHSSFVTGIILLCRSCGNQYAAPEFIEEALSETGAACATCPECGVDSYVFDEH